LKEVVVRRVLVIALVGLESFLLYGIVALTLQLGGDFPALPSGAHLVRSFTVAEHALALRLHRTVHRSRG
jgi:hypothetical protein